MDWLRTRRKELNYSQDDLARALQLAGFDVNRSSISHWESGRFTPPLGNPDFVYELARILKTDTVTVLIKAGYKLKTEHELVSEQIASLVDVMPPDKQTLALKLVEQLME